MLREVLARGAAVLAAATLLVGCAGAQPTPIIVYVTPAPTATPSASPTETSRTLTGHLSVKEGSSAFTDYNSKPGADACLNEAKIHAGAEVLLLNEARTTIGKGVTVYSVPKYTADKHCQLDFVIPDVVPANFYSIRIGLHDGPTWSADEMDAMGWRVTLSL